MFSYHGDVITLAWFWNTLDKRWTSELFKTGYNNMSEYWKHVGVFQEACSRRSGEIAGFSLEEILEAWVRVHYPGQDVVVMYDMDVSKKSTEFWRSVPVLKAKELVQDVVVFQCVSAKQAAELCQSTDPSFANAIAFSFGYKTSSNRDYYIDH